MEGQVAVENHPFEDPPDTNPLCNSRFYVFISLLCSLVLVFCGVFVAKPYISSNQFEDGLCSIKNVLDEKKLLCENCRREDKMCDKYVRYSVRAYVFFRPAGEALQNNSRVFYETPDLRQHSSQFSWFNSQCYSRRKYEESLKSVNPLRLYLMTTWRGPRSRPFQCYQIQDKLRPFVVPRRTSRGSLARVLAAMLIPGVLLLAAIIAAMVVRRRKQIERESEENELGNAAVL